MEIRRYEGPPSRRGEGLTEHAKQILAAISRVHDAWGAAGREPVLHRREDGSVTHDPRFREDIGAELEAIREAARATPAPPEPFVAEALSIDQQREGGRLVCRAVVRWSDGTVGEALAWYADAASIDEQDLEGKTVGDLDRLLLDRLDSRHGP